MVNSALNSSQFYELNHVIFYFIAMSYTGITFDPASNLYLSATVSYRHRFYEPASYGTTGSLILKFAVN